MRKFIVIILTFVLLVFLNLFILSKGLKKIIPNNISSSIIKDTVVSNLSNKLAENFDDDIKEEIILKLKTSKDIDELLDNAVNYLIDTCLYGKKETLNVDKEKLNKLSKDVSNIIVDKYLSSKNLPINNLTDEQLQLIKETLLESFDKDNTLEKEYINVVNTVHDKIYGYTKPYINIFNKIISTSFKMMLIAGVLLIVLLNALLLKSWYKWMISFSVAGILSGIPYAFVLPVVAKTTLNEVLKQYNISFNLNLTSITTPAYLLLGISGVLLIAYIVISLINKNNNIDIDDFKIQDAS